MDDAYLSNLHRVKKRKADAEANEVAGVTMTATKGNEVPKTADAGTATAQTEPSGKTNATVTVLGNEQPLHARLARENVSDPSDHNFRIKQSPRGTHDNMCIHRGLLVSSSFIRVDLLYA